YSEGNVTGGTFVGGVAGCAEYGELINCWSKGHISGALTFVGDALIGGVVGQIGRFASLTDCYYTGVVDSGKMIGGQM
ncbi:MAG: hypothetical protein FWE85_03190, partial [Clostridiales bacterium]|nr:hypothetical protein [Clostridiales bacterium]